MGARRSGPGSNRSAAVRDAANWRAHDRSAWRRRRCRAGAGDRAPRPLLLRSVSAPRDPRGRAFPGLGSTRRNRRCGAGIGTRSERGMSDDRAVERQNKTLVAVFQFADLGENLDVVIVNFGGDAREVGADFRALGAQERIEPLLIANRGGDRPFALAAHLFGPLMLGGQDLVARFQGKREL